MHERTDEEVEKDAAEAESQADALKEEKWLRIEKHFEGISTLPSQLLATIVANIREILWPIDDPDHEWSPDTLEAIKPLFVELGLHREAKEDSDDAT